MNFFRPKLLDSFKGYNGALFSKDVLAGITVGVVALPLAMAFAIASGLKPEAGIFTAIIAGGLISLLGGSRVQIGGPAGAFIVIVYGIVDHYGIANLLLATAMSGVFLFLMGLFRLGTLIRFIPVAVIIGFTNGIAVLIGLSQVKEFFGLQIAKMPAEFFQAVHTLYTAADTINPIALMLSLASLALLIAWRLFQKHLGYLSHIPATVIAMAVATIVTSVFNLPVDTIGSRFGGIPSGLPSFEWIPISWSTAQFVIAPAITLALLGAIESLLCARIADGLIHDRHESNQELMDQGVVFIGAYADSLYSKFMPKDKNQQFSIDELTFSTSDRRILAKNLVVKPKTNSNKQDQFELHIPTLVLNGLDMDNAYKNDQFFFESIVVNKPIFQLFNNAEDSIRLNPFKLNLYRHFESFADVFSSKSLNVNDANITVFKNGQKKLQEKISLNLTKVRIDNKPSHGFLHSADFSFRIANLKKQTKLYQFTSGETFYSSVNNRVTAKDIRIIPNFTKENHQKQVGFQSDYLTGKIDSVCISQPNIQRWFDKEVLAGKYLSANGLNLNIYRDKQIPFDETRRPKMLQDMIKSLKIPISVDSLVLANSQVSYSERTASGDLEGNIRFTNIHTRLMPFTNVKAANGVIPDFNLDGTATIQDSCKLSVKMNYLMNHPENKFTAKGNLSQFNMRILNPVLEPLALVSIRSGKVNRFQFDFSANQTSANGQLFFGYDDLKITVLEMKDGNTKEAKFTSFLANSLMLRAKNPRGKELLPDEINFQRDQKRSVLNYWWKSVFSGIRNTLGIKENKPTEVQEPTH